MAQAYYWSGTKWEPISGGGGGAPGPQGPAGESVQVFVQPTEPTPNRPGDHWINPAASRRYLNADQMVSSYKTLDSVTYPTLDDLKTYPTLDDL